MKYICLVVIAFIFFSPKVLSEEDKFIELNYLDFGPQILAWETIGMNWWQWQATGGSDPDKFYDIKVIVYRDISKAQVEAKFAVDPQQNQDFRYLHYTAAVSYLTEKISELTEIEADWAEKVLITLKNTKARINNRLNNKNN